MASLSFRIRKDKLNENGECCILFRLSYGAYEIRNGKKIYKPLDYHINEFIKPKNWGKGEATKSHIGYQELNARLENIRVNVLDIVRRLENDKVELSLDTIRPEIDRLFDREQKTTHKEIEIMDFISDFIDTHNVSEGTKKSYRIVENNLKEFQELNKLKLTFDKVDIDFYNRFIQFLQGKNYSMNTIGTRIKVLKTFMSEAHERNLHDNKDYQKKAFSKPKEETDTIYLTTSEIDTIYKLDLSSNEPLERVRDWFIIGCYTGLRYSDLRKLSFDDITNGIIKMRMHKTNNYVDIPLHPIVKEIFDKYNNYLPKLISNQKFNDQIKEICKEAKLDEIIVVEETKGKLKTRRKESKYNLISAHTARRSFATNAYLAGVPTIQLMKLTGHKSERTLLNYIRVSNEENAKRLQMHSFFTMAAK